MRDFHGSSVAAGPVRLILPLCVHAAVVVLSVLSKVWVRGGVRCDFKASWVTCTASSRSLMERLPVGFCSLLRAKRAMEVTILVKWCVIRGTGRRCWVAVAVAASWSRMCLSLSLVLNRVSQIGGMSLSMGTLQTLRMHGRR